MSKHRTTTAMAKREHDREQSAVEKAADEYVLADRRWRRLQYRDDTDGLRLYVAASCRADEAERALVRAVLAARKARVKKAKKGKKP